jgi:hypothetical protein
VREVLARRHRLINKKTWSLVIVLRCYIFTKFLFSMNVIKKT